MKDLSDKTTIDLLAISNAILSAILITFCAYALNFFTYSSYPNIDYSNLDEETKLYAEDLVSQIEPQYLESSKKIVFYDTLKYEDNYTIFGENKIFLKSIKMYLSKDYNSDLFVLQHEICHSLVFNIDAEFYCDELANLNFALKKPEAKV